MRTKEEIETLLEYCRRIETKHEDSAKTIREALKSGRMDYTLEDLDLEFRQRDEYRMYRKILEWILGKPLAWCDRALIFIKQNP